MVFGVIGLAVDGRLSLRESVLRDKAWLWPGLPTRPPRRPQVSPIPQSR